MKSTVIMSFLRGVNCQEGIGKRISKGGMGEELVDTTC